jgi:hypothetical protein
VSPQTFALVLVAGSAVLALWVTVRFPASIPSTGKGVSLGLVAAIALLVGTPPAIMAVGGLAGFLGAAFLVVLPAGIGIFLAIAWIMLFVIRAIEPYSH